MKKVKGRKPVAKKYKCDGGPWLGENIAIATDSTAFFQCGKFFGRYVANEIGTCRWSTE